MITLKPAVIQSGEFLSAGKMEKLGLHFGLMSRRISCRILLISILHHTNMWLMINVLWPLLIWHVDKTWLTHVLLLWLNSPDLMRFFLQRRIIITIIVINTPRPTRLPTRIPIILPTSNTVPYE